MPDQIGSTPDPKRSFGYRPDARFRIADNGSDQRFRFLGAALCLILPLSFFILIFAHLVHEFSATKELADLNWRFIADPACLTLGADSKAGVAVATGAPQDRNVTSVADLVISRKALDIAGWYTFSIPSAFLWFISLIGFGFSVLVIGRRTNRVILGCLLIAICGGGAFTAYTLDHHSDTRSILVRSILGAAVSQQEAPPNVLDIAETTVSWNLYLGVVATFGTLFGLATVAVLARSDELNPRILRQRLSDLQWLIATAAAILILTVVVTKGIVGWSISLLCESQSKALEPVGIALGNYWGAAATGVLGGALIPAYLSWSHDVWRYTEKQLPSASNEDQQKLISSEGLNFNPTTSFMTLITVATPALVGPFVEVLKAFTK